MGVSYDADPREVEKILIKAAEEEVLVSKHERPLVRFVGYGDSSLNFELLIWIDVRAVYEARFVTGQKQHQVGHVFRSADAHP